MVVSRLGSPTNNLYRERQQFISDTIFHVYISYIVTGNVKRYYVSWPGNKGGDLIILTLDPPLITMET